MISVMCTENIQLPDLETGLWISPIAINLKSHTLHFSRVGLIYTFFDVTLYVFSAAHISIWKSVPVHYVSSTPQCKKQQPIE